MRLRLNRANAAVVTLVAGACLLAAQTAPPKGPRAPNMVLNSSAFADGAEIPAKYTISDPAPISPKLQWTNVPAETVSFALIFHDPDAAPTKKVDDYLHWVVFNIPPEARELPEAVPAGAQLPDGTIQAKNRGKNGYIGPGAPATDLAHHYMFELFALDIKLDLGPDASRADVVKAIGGHILGRAVLIGRFHR